MPLKRFGEPEPNPNPTFSPSETVKNSRFDPFKPVEDARKSPLGEKVYDDAETKMTPDEAKAVIDQALKSAQSGFDDAEKAIMAYGNAVQRPSDANVKKFTKIMDEIVADPERARAALSVLVAVTSANYRKGR